jgi:uncharacterized protein YceK
MSYVKKRVLLCLALALLVAGCGTIKKDKRTQGLEAAANAYGKAIRWGYYETAYGYVHPDRREPVPKAIENVQVTSYEVVQPPVLGDGAKAQQVVQIEYVLRDEQVVHKVSDRQDWRFDEETETWWLYSPVPAFR